MKEFVIVTNEDNQSFRSRIVVANEFTDFAIVPTSRVHIGNANTDPFYFLCNFFEDVTNNIFPLRIIISVSNCSSPCFTICHESHLDFQLFFHLGSSLFAFPFSSNYIFSVGFVFFLDTNIETTFLYLREFTSFYSIYSRRLSEYLRISYYFLKKTLQHLNKHRPLLEQHTQIRRHEVRSNRNIQELNQILHQHQKW